MRNGGAAATVGEFSDVDIENQVGERAADDGGGGALAENAAVGQSVDRIVEVVVDCSKSEPQLATSQEECRVCQEENEEVLINLGCQCRGGLAKAHHSCIMKWFNSRGSNKCEICQQIATNVAVPDPQASYWVWRVDPAFRAQERERRCFSPLWVAFSILIGGLLLDVLISVTLGVSALPVNIIIGVIVVLGLGTALRLGLEFCQEWNVRRAVQRVGTNANIGYHPAL
ncbi:PREDICTED: E3 ubiquitin-protein ligase MARCH2-like [Erythranthe guttata]|uniref:E3 ubiquitin-protein ligase MARCH2-like n=1 Tax=Erythranthe guttata TaxID=4155 RepID=UPI00064E1245|nr:PREDICTED: E3 ubiquitin-protein ligase MARCH2-like [Erythranthe guttata]|eukprot:XP_012839611.1 PREDICTED: E3 ubiquitin-protein ligase MARCH2-like [Erythranthe guttata]